MSLVVMWLITEFDSFLNVMGAHYLEKVSRNVNAIALNGPKQDNTVGHSRTLLRRQVSLAFGDILSA